MPRKGSEISRWTRISNYLRKHGDEDGWVLWSAMLQGVPLSRVQIKVVLDQHQNEIESRTYRRPTDPAFGKPRHEIRLRPTDI